MLPVPTSARALVLDWITQSKSISAWNFLLQYQIKNKKRHNLLWSDVLKSYLFTSIHIIWCTYIQWQFKAIQWQYNENYEQKWLWKYVICLQRVKSWIFMVWNGLNPLDFYYQYKKYITSWLQVSLLMLHIK